MAYVTFTCSLRGAASSWLQYFTTVHRNNPQEWNSIRPHFFSAFKNQLSYSSATAIASAVDTNVVSHNTDVAFDNNTNVNKFSYASTLTNLLDQYVASTEAPNGHNFTAAQFLYIKGMMHDELQDFRDDLQENGVKINNMTRFVGRLVPIYEETIPDVTHNQPRTGGNTKRFNKLFCTAET